MVYHRRPIEIPISWESPTFRHPQISYLAHIYRLYIPFISHIPLCAIVKKLSTGVWSSHHSREFPKFQDNPMSLTFHLLSMVKSPGELDHGTLFVSYPFLTMDRHPSSSWPPGPWPTPERPSCWQSITAPPRWLSSTQEWWVLLFSFIYIYIYICIQTLHCITWHYIALQ